jgi:hypothetical protein
LQAVVAVVIIKPVAVKAEWVVAAQVVLLL